MVADIGNKALPLYPFARLRDIIKDYRIFKAVYPNKAMWEHAYEEKMNGVLVNLVGMRRAIISYKFEMRAWVVGMDRGPWAIVFNECAG